jgi:hypothetical protein
VNSPARAARVLAPWLPGNAAAPASLAPLWHAVAAASLASGTTAGSPRELCQQIAAPGGTIANVGVHGVKVDLHLETLWSHNVTITTRLVDTVSIPMLLKTVQSKRIDAQQLITHRFKLGDILKAYETFGKAADTKALKVIIEASGARRDGAAAVPGTPAPGPETARALRARSATAGIRIACCARTPRRGATAIDETGRGSFPTAPFFS